MRVEVFADVVCPWCYVGHARFRAALAAFPHAGGVEVVHRAYELDPDATGTQPVLDALAGTFGGLERARAADAAAADQARAEGLVYTSDRLHGPTRDVHRVLALADETGQRGAVTDAVLTAHFSGSADVLLRDPLLDVVAAAGLDRDRAAAVHDDPEAYAVDVRRDRELAAELGVTAVPTFVLNRRLAVAGAQPPDVLRAALDQAWRLPEC